MKILITGASGFVGRQLVPALSDAGIQLMLVGRDRDKLSSLFPGMDCETYETLADDGVGFDLLVHLSAANNSLEMSEEAFTAANVTLFSQVIEATKTAGIPRLINISTLHALDPSKSSAYARSKRAALEVAGKAEGIDIVSVFLPLVYGEAFGGRLKPLNRLPKWLARPLFGALSALAPTVHINKLTDFLRARAVTADPAQEVFLSDRQEGNLVYAATTRAIDILFALAVIGFFWWLLLIVWVAVRYGSPGPGVFAQERIGRHGRAFTFYKFRTMRLGTPQAGTHEISAQSVTRIGTFLRKTKLDELPQVWNILRGQISLIGPRPSLPVQVELIDARRARGVLDVRPGISGLAQINGIDMSDPIGLARWDALYVARRSLLVDFQITLATFLGGGQGDKLVA